MKKEKFKSDIIISSKQQKTKNKLIAFSLGVSENCTKQNSFRKVNDLKFKTTKNSPDKPNKNEEKKIIQQKQSDEFLKQQILKKKESSILKRTNFLNFSNPIRKTEPNNKNNNNSNSNEHKHHINIIPTNLNYQKACVINSNIASPKQIHNKPKINSLSNSNIQKKNKNNKNNFINKNKKKTNKINKDNNLIDIKNKDINKNDNNENNNSLNISVQNNNNNKELNSKNNNIINYQKIEKKDLKLINKHISQTTPVTNVNSRRTSNEKKISHHHFIQSKKNSILTNLTHNKKINFQTSNTEDFFSHSSIHNLKTNYSNERYIPLKQNNISKTILVQSNSFKPNFTTGNSPHYYKKNLSKKKKRLKENILFNKCNLKPSTISVKKGNYTSSASKDVLRNNLNNLEVNRKIISSSKTSTNSLSKTISHKSSINKIQYMTLNINKKIIIPKNGKIYTENNKIKNKNVVINKITRTTNSIPNKTKKIVKEISKNINKKKERNKNIINENKSNNNITISTFKDDDNLNESKIILKKEMLKEGIYYLKESEKLSTYLKKYYNKYHEYPKTKLAFYKFGRLIGRGAFGKVNLGLHILSGRIVAIKSFNKKKLKTKESIDKIYNEINLMKNLRHNFIVKILEYIETEKYILIIMENISGGDLLSFVKKRTKLPEKTCQYIFKQLISGLKFIHSKGIIHRDIKLDNILIDLNNNIKICDFGVSKNYKKNEKLNDQCGTPAYIAPEILNNNNGYYGPPVDIWSSGVVLYAMLSGNVPFKANNLNDLHKLIISGKYNYIKDISNDATNLINQILEVDPNKRIDINGIINHPWFMHNYNFDEGKNSLFTKAEIVLLSKENIDYRYCDKKEMIENFTIKNLYTLNDKENKNVNTKSIILAPFNSSYENNVNYCNLEKNLDVYNDVIQFNENTKLLNRLYELNNNGEIDHGVLINQNSDNSELEDYNEIKINDLDEELDNINKNNICEGRLNKNDNILFKQNSKRNNSYLTNSSTFIIDESVLKTMESLGYKKDYIQKILNNNELNYASATYFLLSNQNEIN